MDLWFLDNECNNHMRGNSKITLGDDSQVKALGKGIVFVLTKQAQNKYIHNVYYVWNLKHNMISVVKFMEHGNDDILKDSMIFG